MQERTLGKLGILGNSFVKDSFQDNHYSFYWNCFIFDKEQKINWHRFFWDMVYICLNNVKDQHESGYIVIWESENMMQSQFSKLFAPVSYQRGPSLSYIYAVWSSEEHFPATWSLLASALIPSVCMSPPIFLNTVNLPAPATRKGKCILQHGSLSLWVAWQDSMQHACYIAIAKTAVKIITDTTDSGLFCYFQQDRTMVLVQSS